MEQRIAALEERLGLGAENPGASSLNHSSAPPDENDVADEKDVGTLTPLQIESERKRLASRLAELDLAQKLYAKSPALVAVFAGQSKAIKDRLFELERFAAGGPTFVPGCPPLHNS